jgi:hypothetical protein
MSLDLLTLKRKLKELSFDDFESALYVFSDEFGFLSSDQMLILDVECLSPLHVEDFLDIFLYTRILNS